MPGNISCPPIRSLQCVVNARPLDTISYTQRLSNSLIRKSSLCFQHNSTKESYDTSRIVCTRLYHQTIQLLTSPSFSSIKFFVCFLKVGGYSLKIHKFAYNLFSVFISKRGFSSLQTRKSFSEILSGNHRFLRPGIRLDDKLHILTQQKYYLSTIRL